MSVGCGDDEGSTPAPIDQDNGTGNDDDDVGNVSDPLSRFATLIRLRQPDGTVEGTYLETHEELDPTETITTGNARELIPGFRLRRYQNFAYLEEFGSPSVTQLAYDPATGELAEDGLELSFSSRGMRNVLVSFFSPNKAYGVDRSRISNGFV